MCPRGVGSSKVTRCVQARLSSVVYLLPGKHPGCSDGSGWLRSHRAGRMRGRAREEIQQQGIIIPPFIPRQQRSLGAPEDAQGASTHPQWRNCTQYLPSKLCRAVHRTSTLLCVYVLRAHSVAAVIRFMSPGAPRRWCSTMAHLPPPAVTAA